MAVGIGRDRDGIFILLWQINLKVELRTQERRSEVASQHFMAHYPLSHVKRILPSTTTHGVRPPGYSAPHNPAVHLLGASDDSAAVGIPPTTCL